MSVYFNDEGKAIGAFGATEDELRRYPELLKMYIVVIGGDAIGTIESSYSHKKERPEVVERDIGKIETVHLYGWFDPKIVDPVVSRSVGQMIRDVKAEIATAFVKMDSFEPSETEYQMRREGVLSWLKCLNMLYNLLEKTRKFQMKHE